MKRLFAVLVTCALLLCLLPITAYASETSTEITYFEDGSYIVTSIEHRTSRMLTKVSSKTSTYYSADDVPQFKVTITGEFLYDGTTVTCTYASGNTTIYEPSGWSKVTERTRLSGNTATHTTTFNNLLFGIVVDTFDFSVTITCDENGNIS